MLRKTKAVLAIALPLQVLFIEILSEHPQLVEQFYSTGIYPYISMFLRISLGWIPFSFGDICYGFIILYSIWWCFKNLPLLLKKTKTVTVSFFAFLSVVYFCFHILWGLNYYREPLHTTLGLEQSYNTEALIELTKKLIKKTNKLQIQLAKNDSSNVVIPYQISEIFTKTQQGYSQLATTHPQLACVKPSIKTSLFSLPLSYMGFSGYLNPFTNEAQVNYLIPKGTIPLVSSHEQGHQIGYAAENETNFIGFLASINNRDLYFKYAGYAFALRHCLFELSKRDSTQYALLKKSIHKGVLENYKENRLFWNAYQNPFEPIFKHTFDLFLKRKKQKTGIKSYNKVVALLVNYDLKNDL